MNGKRRASMFPVTLVTIILLLAAAMPHHHHDAWMCFAEAHCAHDADAARSQGNPDPGPHSHDGQAGVSACLSSHPFLLPKGNAILEKPGSNQVSGDAGTGPLPSVDHFDDPVWKVTASAGSKSQHLCRPSPGNANALRAPPPTA